MIDRGGILKLDIYTCWLVLLRPTAVPLNSGCGWGKLESSLSFAFHILKKNMIPVNITFCSPTSTEICSANLGPETTFPTLPPGRPPLWRTQTHLLHPMAPKWSKLTEGAVS